MTLKERLFHPATRQKLLAFASLLALMVFFTAASPNFLQTDNLVAILQATAVNGVLAIACTFVIITSGIDLSVGTLMTFCAVMAGVFLTYLGLPIYVGVLAAIFFGALIGFVSGAMFFSIGVMYDRVHSRQIADYGGVVNKMPKFAAFFMLFTMANAGLPATSGFVGEFMVILGAVGFNFWVAFAAASTMIVGAAYSLWMYKRVYFGDVTNDEVRGLTDINAREFGIMAVLAIATLWMGVYPKPFTDVMHASVTQLLQHVAASKLQ